MLVRICRTGNAPDRFDHDPPQRPSPLPVDCSVATFPNLTSFPTRDRVGSMPSSETTGQTGPRTNPPEPRPTMFDDPPPEIEARVIEGYRAMSPAERLARVVSLNRALEALATARIRSRYGPELSARELRLRLGSLRVGREEMVRAFDWDPVERGY